MSEIDPLHRGPASDIVLLERLRRRQPEPDGSLVTTIRERLRGLEEQLAPAEREALSMLLRSLGSQNAPFVELAALPPEAICHRSP